MANRGSQLTCPLDKLGSQPEEGGLPLNATLRWGRQAGEKFCPFLEFISHKSRTRAVASGSLSIFPVK